MKECANCKKEFEPKRPHGKFCSDRCRIAYNRSHPKETVTKFQMQVLYNSLIEAIESFKTTSQQPYFGVAAKEEVKWGETMKEPVKITFKRPFATLQALINECESEEAYEPLRREIEEATHLTSREKAILLRKR